MLILAGLGLHGRGGSARLRALQRGCWGGQRDYALVLLQHARTLNNHAWPFAASLPYRTRSSASWTWRVSPAHGIDLI